MGIASLHPSYTVNRSCRVG